MNKKLMIHKQKGAVDTAVVYAFCFLFLSVIGSFIYFSLYGNPVISSVKTLQKTVEVASTVKSYTAEVVLQPEGVVSSSEIITGTVKFDVAKNEKSGTFNFPPAKGEVVPSLIVKTFSDAQGEVASFESNDVSPVSGLKYPNDWVKIPDGSNGVSEYELIKKTNAFFDIYEVFQKGGPYLLSEGEAEKVSNENGSELHFALRATAVDSLRPAGTSDAFNNVLTNGNMNVWVSSKDKTIHQVRYALGGYLVTVKVKDINVPVTITKAESVVSLFDWKSKQFASYEPADAVKEIFIGSYGTIKKEYLEGVRSAVEKATGIKAVVLLSGAALPMKTPLYNLERKQFDAVPIFEGVKTASEKYGPKSRFIYIVDIDLYSSADKATKSIWYLDQLGVNTSLVSLYNLRKVSDTNEALTASQPLIISRAGKVALHVLGSSVGFSLSPSTEQKDCVMSKATTLAELDTQKVGYCAPENTVTTKYFTK